MWSNKHRNEWWKAYKYNKEFSDWMFITVVVEIIRFQDNSSVDADLITTLFPKEFSV